MINEPSTENVTQESGVQQALIRLTFEMSELRRERRNGWHHIHEDPESVAEHCHRASILGFLLASYAKIHEPAYADVDPSYVTTLVVFHDMHEARSGDDDLVQKKYVKINAPAVIVDQVDGLGGIGAKISAIWEEVEHKSSPAGTLAKDAEILEMAFTARELVFNGNLTAQAWIDAVRVRLTSESAKELIELLNISNPQEWWRKLLGYSNNAPTNGEPDLPVFR